MRRFAAPALLVLATLLGAGAAEAFTLEPVNPSVSSGSQKLAEPDDLAPIQRLTPQPNGSSGMSFGDSGFRFSVTGGSYGPTTNYFDASRPPQLAPYGFGDSPFLPYRR